MLSKLTDEELEELIYIFQDLMSNRQIPTMLKVLYSNLAKFVDKAIQGGRLADRDLLLIFHLFVHLESVRNAATSGDGMIKVTLENIYRSQPYSPDHLKIMRMVIY